MLLLDIINKKSYYFSQLESLCESLQMTCHISEQHALMINHLKPGAHIIHHESEYQLLEALLKKQEPDLNLQLEHLHDPITTLAKIRSSFFSLLELEPCNVDNTSILAHIKHPSLKTELESPSLAAHEKSSVILKHLPKEVIDLLDPKNTNLIEIIETHFQKLDIKRLIEIAQLSSTSKSALITNSMKLATLSLEEKYHLLLKALPAHIAPLLSLENSQFKIHAFVQKFKDKINITELATELKIGSAHASNLDIIRLKLNALPVHQAKKMLLHHLKTDEVVSQADLALLKAIYESLYDPKNLWRKFQFHAKIDQQHLLNILKEKNPTFDGSDFSQISYSSLETQLLKHIENVTPDVSTALIMLSELPTELFDHQKLVISSIARYMQQNSDFPACKHQLLTFLKSAINPLFLESVLPKSRTLSKAEYFKRYEKLLKKMFAHLNMPEITQQFLDQTAFDVKTKLSAYLMTQTDLLLAIDELNIEQLLEDPEEFEQILDLARLDDSTFLKIYFKLHHQFQPFDTFLEEAVESLNANQAKIGPFCAATYKTLNLVPSTKEYFQNVKILIKTIEEKYSKSDATLIYLRLLSSADIRSTSSFRFKWSILDFKQVFKYQPWLYGVPSEILAIMNIMHSDFLFIEAHTTVQGCRFFVPDIAENEIRRQQIRTLMQFKIQSLLFKRIHDQTISITTDPKVMQFFSVACSKQTPNQFHQSYKRHAQALLFEEGPLKIKQFAQKVFPQWTKQLQELINNNTNMSKTELVAILNSILLTPSFIFEKVIHELRTQSPELNIDTNFLALCANLNYTVGNFESRQFQTYQGNIQEQHLAMISLYIQYTQNLNYKEAQKKTLSLPLVIHQVILSNCNFVFRTFLDQCIKAIEKNNLEHTIILSFDMELSPPQTIDLSALFINGTTRNYSNSLIKLVEHIDQYSIEHSPQQVNAIRDAINHSESHHGWERPLRQAQIDFENGQAIEQSLWDKIKKMLLHLLYQWFPEYQNAQAAYNIAADQEYLRAEMLRAEFIQNFQKDHPSQPISNCYRTMLIQERAGILPPIQPIY
ncbi:MAG: hypothetical protein FJ186_03110 [Gammaproteobacteria bacterium]|nr:hypothetical protein [Gammaproteobacteria bacterium]